MPAFRLLLPAVAVLLLAAPASAQPLRPYLLASEGPGEVASKAAEARQALEAAGFEVVGEYAPHASAKVLVATSDELKAAASKSEYGGYGAVVRVGITRVGEAVQVSFTNPVWQRAVYRMAGDGAAVAKKLEAALGGATPFGSEKGLSEKALRDYHYMVLMPFFTDPVKLASFPDHDAALAAVEKGLAAKAGGAVRVYRVDVPGKKETVFGVGLTRGDSSDGKVIDTIDTAARRHSAHFPYELLVTDGTVRMLHGRFRIAQSWPDLTMGSFMKIGATPDAIEAAFKQVVGR